MPTAKIQLEDGRIARFEVPEGTTQDQVMAFIEQNRSQFQQQDIVSQIPTGISGVTERKYDELTPVQKPEPTIGEMATGAGETALTMATGATTGTLGLVGGFIKGLADEVRTGEFGSNEAADRIEQKAMESMQALTYAPRSEVGREYTSEIGKAATQLTPVIPIMNEMVGLRALGNVRKGTRLIDDLGEPTQALRKALDKNGLVYENLTPEARAVIPKYAEPKLLSSGKSAVAENALIKQIKSGARDDALAGLKVVNNKIHTDKLANEAIRQGFEPGFVQAVKTASPETKIAMGKMLTMMERITKNQRLGLEFRPSNVAGEAALSRFRFIRRRANEARDQLNVIAENKLPGKEVNIQPVIDQLGKSLDDLNVQLTSDGIPKPIYAGSDISLDPTSQGMINKLIGEMASGKPGVKPDAYRLHRLKRQLDRLIDFQKKSEGGLTDAGRDVLKDVRRSINQSLRDADPAYAKVNDILHESLTAINDFQDAVGPSIAKLNMMDKRTESAVGTKLRTLMSNYASRQGLENALEQLDTTANNLGGTFKVDYKDLAQFANKLDNRFGTVAETSFKGDIGATLKQATTQGASETLKGKAFEMAAEKANKLRGINDFNAFNSMRELLKEKRQ